LQRSDVHLNYNMNVLNEAAEMEISTDPCLSSERQTIVDLHSIINLVNVLHGCLQLLRAEGGAELQKVVEFGYRSSNALGKRTHGGGFGLSKALWVAKNFGGRMWIRSCVGVGTRVTIFIPAQPGKSAVEHELEKAKG